MLRLVGECQLVRTEPERRLHRRVELANGALAELLDAEVESANPLHRAVGETLRQRPVACVQTRHRRLERAVGVGILLEDAPDDVVRRSTSRRDHRRPRRNSSYVIWLRPSGCTTSGTNSPFSKRAFQIVMRLPCSSPRAPI